MGKIRKTRDGNLLIELRKDSKLEEVSGAIRKAVRDELLGRPLVPTVTIELRDLEETTTEEEIKEAFITALVEVTPDQVEVKALRAGPRGTKAALGYRLTQGLSGHGCFGVYLARRGHRPNSNCRLCSEQEDDVENPIFAYPVHEQDRRELAVQVGTLLSKNNIIATMLKSPESWDRIASFIKRAIKTKRR